MVQLTSIAATRTHPRASGLALALGVLIATSGQAMAAGVEDFYKGRTVTIIAGSAPGGGYDLYARLISRVFSRHVPGQPSVIVSNMPGAAGNVAAAHIGSVAPKDGTVIGALYMGTMVEPLFGQARATHDISKFILIGNANKDVYVCIARSDAPAKSFKDAMATELILGASADGAGTKDFPTMLRNLLGVKFKVVAGYQGTPAINLALEKGEVHAGCGQTWSSLAATYPHWFQNKTVQVIAQEDSTGYPALNQRKVPLTRDFATTDEQRAILDLVYGQTDFGRPYVVAPGVPEDRVAALRTAFVKSMTDPDLIAEAKKINLDIDFTPGAELQTKLAKIYSSSPELVKKARDAIAGK